MSECSICGQYSECLHPVDFKGNPNDPDCPEEIKPFLGIGKGAIDDLDVADEEEEFWDNCARICHECFSKYKGWIVWWG